MKHALRMRTSELGGEAVPRDPQARSPSSRDAEWVLSWFPCSWTWPHDPVWPMALEGGDVMFPGLPLQTLQFSWMSSLFLYV